MKSTSLFIISSLLEKYIGHMKNAENPKDAEAGLLGAAVIIKNLLLFGVDRFFSDEEDDIIREDADTHLPYGLCKEYGIELPDGASPADAWAALKEKTGREPGSFYAEKATSEQKERAIKVRGPKQTKAYIQKRLKENPKLAEVAKKFKSILSEVRDFDKNHPNAEDGTYDALTGKNVSDEIGGYCVTFHQNLTADDPFGGYDDDDYAAMCAIAQNDLGSKSVYIGHYGNPEVSFTCPSVEKAFKFSVEHNQESIYDTDSGKLIRNVYYYDNEANPIRE